MNSDSFAVVGAGFPATHPFNVANLSTSIGLTETAFSFTTTTGPAIVSVPLQTDIRGASAPFDVNANNALSVDQFGRASGYRNVGRPWFTSQAFDGRGFRLRAMGKASFTAAGGGATTIAVNLYQGTSATLGSDTKIAGPTALSVAATKVALVNFVVEATMMWDAATQVIFGEFWASISGNVDVGGANTKTASYTSRGALTNPAVAAAPANLTFLASVAFGTTAPAGGGSVILQELSLEQA